MLVGRIGWGSRWVLSKRRLFLLIIKCVISDSFREMQYVHICIIYHMHMIYANMIPVYFLISKCAICDLFILSVKCSVSMHITLLWVLRMHVYIFLIIIIVLAI